jgi:hypothetical protein
MRLAALQKELDASRGVAEEYQSLMAQRDVAAAAEKARAEQELAKMEVRGALLL